MKNVILTVFLALFCATLPAQTYFSPSASYAGGDGTKTNPYRISNAAELAKLAEDVNGGNNWSRGKYFVLTNDIVLNENLLSNSDTKLEGQTAGTALKPIGTFSSYDNYVPFMGVFDGQGYTISGMYQPIFVANDALFCSAENAVIKNVNIKDSYIYGGKYCAGVVSFATNSTIINCSFEGKIKSWEWYAAGIVGQVLGTSKIQNCYAKCTINAKNYLGGIVGIVGKENDAATVTYNTVVENCYSISSIKQTDGSKGAIAGRINSGAIVRNCYYKKILLTGAIQQNNGTAENLVEMTDADFATSDFVTTLNANAEQIPGACRWTQTETSPVFDHTTITPEEEVIDVNDQASDPMPKHEDFHAENTDGVLLLSWTAPASGKAVAYNLYVGKDKDVVRAMSVGDTQYAMQTECSATLQIEDYNSIYYWRVDPVDAAGNVTPGEIWSFRPAHLAFPGAEGYGRYARGGRGGKVVYVTNLNNDGEGSLRWALTNESGPRTVLFKVSGLIDMNFIATFVDDEVTIAGQSAPGKGICLAHSDVAIGSDNICRFIRARRGGGETGNAMGVAGSNHTIVDHVTASWGTDETFSSRNSKNVTFQRSIISEALGIAGHKNYASGTNHGYAATIGGDIGSFHHNLLANCHGRNWSMGGGADASGAYAGRLDIFNNVVYNWGSRSTDGGAHEINFVGNYYKMGPATKEKCLFTLQLEGNLPGTQSAYVAGNVRENLNGTVTKDKRNDTYCYQIRDDRTGIDWDIFPSEPFYPSYAKIETAEEAYKSVLSDIGAYLPMTDNTDKRIVRETLNRTYTYTGSVSGIKGQIDDESDAGGYEVYPEESYDDSFDADWDGLPNWWEEIFGSNLHSPAEDFSDANADPDGDGYTVLEDYLDFMANLPHLVKADTTITILAEEIFAGYTDNPVFSVVESDSRLDISVNGNRIMVKPLADKMVAQFSVRVTDAVGHGYQRRICVGVHTDAANSLELLEDKESAPLRSFMLYTMGGELVKSASCVASDTYGTLDLSGVPAGIYLLKTIDVNNQQRSYKIIR